MCKHTVDNGNGIRWVCVKEHNDAMHVMEAEYPFTNVVSVTYTETVWTKPTYVYYLARIAWLLTILGTLGIMGGILGAKYL